MATNVAMRLGLRGPQAADVMRADAANPTGYWESHSLAVLNDRLLGLLGATWWTPPQELTDADLATLSPMEARAAEAFEAAFGSRPGWVWKDPRLSVLLPFWCRVLGDQPVLFPTRAPQRIAQSISKRDGVSYEAALGIWESHTRCVLTSLGGRRVLVVRYEELLRQPRAWAQEVYEFARSSGLPVAPIEGDVDLVPPPQHDEEPLPPAPRRLDHLLRDLRGVHDSFPVLSLPPANGAVVSPQDLDRIIANSAPQSAHSQLEGVGTLATTLVHRRPMSELTEPETEPTGERFIPEKMGGELIDAEHQLRYRFTLEHVRGKRVLDAGCGVGWGTKLLLEAGAAEVTGLDISEEAIEDGRRRVPEAQFRQGDLMDLPFDDDAFDVVVCFEALEHTSDTGRTLDELARVLVAGGVLFVSSPNPAVYPAGNPFHLHEMPPEELQAAVAQRFSNVRMFRQHQYIASLLYPDADEDAAAGFQTHAHPVTPIAPGHDPYSVAVASDEALPELAVWETLAPSSQLDSLGAMATNLAEERELLHADHQRIAAERGAVIAQLEQAQQQLRDADAALRDLMGQRDDAVQNAAELDTRVQALTVQLDHQRSVAANAARERDDYGMRLIDAQQGAGGSPGTSRSQELDALRERLSKIEDELHQTRRTVSWRVTRPLRSLRTVVSSRGGR